MMSVRGYIGIDPGMRRVAITTNTPDQEWRTDVFTYKHKRPTDRLHELHDWMLQWAGRTIGPRQIVLAVEAPLGQLQGKARWMPAFWWAITRTLERFLTCDVAPAQDWLPGALPPLLCLDPSPASVKKFVTGKGNAPKGQVLVRIVERWRDELPEVLRAPVAEGNYEKVSDELESYAMARMAQCAADITLGMDALMKPPWRKYQINTVQDVLEMTARAVGGR